MMTRSVPTVDLRVKVAREARRICGRTLRSIGDAVPAAREPLERGWEREREVVVKLSSALTKTVDEE
jgi:hypothetical protein